MVGGGKGSGRLIWGIGGCGGGGRLGWRFGWGRCKGIGWVGNLKKEVMVHCNEMMWQ